MMQKKTIRILHVFTDDKFFDGTANFFMSIPNTINLFYYYSKTDKPFKYIKNESIVTKVLSWKDYKSLFEDPYIDVIYFHSMPLKYYKLFKYIDSKKKVIWWAWGCDIYNRYGLLKPFIGLDLYKPLTKNLLRKESFLKIVYRFFKSLTLLKLRNKMLSRIDYFSPIIPFEYELMKNNPQFKAKPFMLESSPSLGYKNKNDFSYQNKPHNIIIGNSLTLTNNHLDIFDKIKNIRLLNDRLYIVPINYGNMNFKNKLKNSVQNISVQFKWLESFMPRNEYYDLFRSITHAIFGHIRQQAMGNIKLCLKNGVKIYLYKDSIIYHELKKKGYYIYTIEDDLNEESLTKVLLKEEAIHNYTLYCHIGHNKIEETSMELQMMLR